MAARRRIAVIGGREASEEALQFAYDIGRKIAEKNAILFTGGAFGVMEAASKGASEAGGTVVGILKEDNISKMNAYVEIPIATGMGDMRNSIILRSVDGAIAVAGGYGTLSEIAFARGYEVPVVAFKSWDIPGVIPVKNADEAIETLYKLLEG
jgi:uncharacterized protein (TIGR00725 family)